MAIKQLHYKQIDQKLRQRRAQAATLQLRNLASNPGIPEEQRAKAVDQIDRIKKWVKDEL
jgi:hypothetical protein